MVGWVFIDWFPSGLWLFHALGKYLYCLAVAPVASIGGRQILAYKGIWRDELFFDTYNNQVETLSLPYYWVTQKLPQIWTVILRIRIGKVVWFALYICGNFWVTQYIYITQYVHCLDIPWGAGARGEHASPRISLANLPGYSLQHHTWTTTTVA